MISNEEAVTFVKLGKALFELAGHSPSGQTPQSPAQLAQAVASSLFRVFDSGASGAMGAGALARILSSWLVTLLNLATDAVLQL